MPPIRWSCLAGHPLARGEDTFARLIAGQGPDRTAGWASAPPLGFPELTCVVQDRMRPAVGEEVLVACYCRGRRGTVFSSVSSSSKMSGFVAK